MKLVLVGNKVDLEDQRQVPAKRGEKVCNRGTSGYPHTRELCIQVTSVCFRYN